MGSYHFLGSLLVNLKPKNGNLKHGQTKQVAQMVSTEIREGL